MNAKCSRFRQAALEGGRQSWGDTPAGSPAQSVEGLKRADSRRGARGRRSSRSRRSDGIARPDAEVPALIADIKDDLPLVFDCPKDISADRRRLRPPTPRFTFMGKNQAGMAVFVRDADRPYRRPVNHCSFRSLIEDVVLQRRRSRCGPRGRSAMRFTLLSPCRVLAVLQSRVLHSARQ